MSEASIHQPNISPSGVEQLVLASETSLPVDAAYQQASTHSFDTVTDIEERRKQVLGTIESARNELRNSSAFRDPEGRIIEGTELAIDMQRELADEIVASGDQIAMDDATEMFLNGTLRGVSPTEALGQKGHLAEHHKVMYNQRKLAKLMHLYKGDPEAAVAIAENHVAGFHGSRSSMLYSFLEHDGLLTAAAAREQGINIASGERRYAPNGGQADISFADWSEPLSIASYSSVSEPKTIESMQEAIDHWKDYLHVTYNNQPLLPAVRRNVETIIADNEEQLKFVQENPHSPETALILEDFPVAFGVDVSSYPVVPGARTADWEELRGVLNPRTSGDITGEFAIHDDRVPAEKLPVIAVPAGKVEEVQALFDAHDKKVKVMDIGPLRSDIKLARRIRRPTTQNQ